MGEACRIALEETKKALASCPGLSRVIFAVFSAEARQIYDKMAKEVF
jgi:hypothetical protein